MQKDLITVIIPVYKVEKYLDKALESVVCQTYKNLEIILIDDGSPDNCPQICDDWASKDDRIIVVHNKNEGVSVARNTALDMIKGEYIYFLDADDYISENALALLYAALIENNVDMCMANYTIIDENNEVIEKPIAPEIFNTVLSGIEKFGEHNLSIPYLVVWNKLYKAYLFENIRFPVGITHGEDSILSHIILEKSNSYICIDENTYYYLQRDGSAMDCSTCATKIQNLTGMFLRLDFYREQGNLDNLEYAQFNKIIYNLNLCYKNFDCDVEYRNIFKEAVIKTRKYYNKINKKHFSFKEKMRYLVFLSRPHLFYKISRFLSEICGK